MNKKKTIYDELKKLGWEWCSTGGNCTAYYKTIEKETGTHYLMTVPEGLSIPTRRNQKVTIGVYQDPENLTYTEAGIDCNLQDILSGRIKFRGEGEY